MSEEPDVLRDLLERMLSELDHYPPTGSGWDEAELRLSTGHPLCDIGRLMMRQIPDASLDRNGDRNFPSEGGELWYRLLRTSRKPQIDEEVLLATAARLSRWLRQHYSSKLALFRSEGSPSRDSGSPENSTSRRFAIALSFPGEHRDFVAQVAEHLSAPIGHDRVLYDKYYEAEFARVDLDVYLPKLYREQSELIVVFLCPDYEKKRWCKLEWRHIRQLIATAEEGRIMLTSFGNPGDVSEIGIMPGDGYVDIGTRDPAAIADLILQRLHATPPIPTVPASPTTKYTPTPKPHPAFVMWWERLDLLLVEEAKVVDPAMKFKIQQDIKEARGKIQELGGQA